MPREYISEFYKHEGDDSWFEEGEILYEELLDQLREDFPEVMDQHAADVLWAGFFDPNLDFIDRTYARYEFFDYTHIRWDDFDWDEWREWYES